MNGKSIIVTGGGSGIGRATAIHLGKAGAQLTIADLNEDSAAQTAATIQNAGGRAQHIRTDVRDEQQVNAMVELAVSQYGRLDGAANCAGAGQAMRPLHEITLEQWRACQDANLTSAFLCLKHQIEAFLRHNDGGSIVVVSSTAAMTAIALMAEYAAAKAGILALVRNAAFEYGRRGIRVNAVLPGPTDTPMMRDSLSRSPFQNPMAISSSRVPLGRVGEPRELGATIAWLLSDEASFVTGVILPVDGGQTTGATRGDSPAVSAAP